ncbi:MAG: autotransporter assembly complex family protein [Parvularculaceae bacterium]
MNVQRCVLLTGLWFASALIAAPGARADGPSYSVAFEGAPKGLKEKLELVSDLKSTARPLPTAAALKLAARRDARTFEEAMQAAGYYAGAADFRLEESAGKKDWRIIFEIMPGPKFKITEYRIVYADAPLENAEDKRPQSLEDAGVNPDGDATGAALRDLQRVFLNVLWERAYPAARIVSRRAEADLEAGTATAVFVFESGPHARFGPLSVTGLKRTDPEHLEKLITWTQGEFYERSKLIAFRSRLAATGLFSTIDVAAGAPDENGAAPVVVKVTERKNRTIGGGLSFSTTDGPGGRLFFENRNVFHRGERIRLEFIGSGLEQSATLNFNKPLPRFSGSGYAQARFSNETTDAFNARSYGLSGGLAKKLIDDRLEARAGVALETSNVRADGAEERTYFVSTPASLLWNSEDDLLDPKKGVRAALTMRPYTGTDSFTQAEATARTRVLFGPGDRLTAAFRTRLGATFNTSLTNLPLNKRFYAGGGGSVRGFSFQEAGPLDAENDPTGGLSVVEGAFEGRVRTLKNVQLAGFVDAGSVSSKRLPDVTGDYFVGVGGGVRYLTTVGPIRLDVAFPLDKRPTDTDFQIFISLGQAF